MKRYYGTLDAVKQYRVDITDFSVALVYLTSLQSYNSSSIFAVLYRKSGYQLMAATWNTNVDHLIALGADNGTLMLIDTRRTDTDSVHESIKYDRGVHKLLFNPNSEK